MTFMKHIECSISNNRFICIDTLFRGLLMFLYDTGIEQAFKMILVALKPLKQAQQLVKHCFKHNGLVKERRF